MDHDCLVINLLHGIHITSFDLVELIWGLAKFQNRESFHMVVFFELLREFRTQHFYDDPGIIVKPTRLK